MASANQAADWSALAAMLSDRYGSLSERVLEGLRELLAGARPLVNCAEAALLVPNADGTHLDFLVSVNSQPGVAEIVTQMSVPCDRSIVGCVFSTGQLIAIANPDDFYQEVDQKTGLKTREYLVTPVIDGEEILGVATFVNRPEDQPAEPFNEREIEASVRVADLAVAGLRFYQRLVLQQKLFETDLRRAAQRFAGPTAAGPSRDDSAEIRDHSPMARVMRELERMSPRDQELAADLLGVLASHTAGGEVYW